MEGEREEDEDGDDVSTEGFDLVGDGKIALHISFTNDSDTLDPSTRQS